MGKALVLVVFSFSYFFSQSQEITSQGIFVQDSVKIGESIEYRLTVKYPIGWQVILPDSTFDYSPFEYYGKRYFPTRMDSIYAYDSVIYRVATFEIDPVQSLGLPVFIVDRGDSTILETAPDSVFFQEMVTAVSDSIQLRSNVSYLPVGYRFNYPYWGIGLGAFVVVLIAISLIFGGKIKAKIRLYRLKKEYEKFSLKFETGISKIRQSETNSEVIEDILVIWKKYMERLEDKPFTKYTSREINMVGYGDELKNVLQNIDRAIYSRPDDEAMHKNFESLEDFTQERYLKKVKEVQYG